MHGGDPEVQRVDDSDGTPTDMGNNILGGSVKIGLQMGLHNCVIELTALHLPSTNHRKKSNERVSNSDT